MTYGMRDIFLSAVLACAAYSQIPPDKELALGQPMAERIESNHKLVTDAEVIAFVERILNTLSHDQSLRLPPKLLIIDDGELIASALPGGFVILSSGAILHSNSEAELAGLLAHAMGHVQSGQSNRPIKVTGISVPVVFSGGTWGLCVRTGDSAVLALAIRAQSDLFESQADLLALGYMLNAGYDPRSMVTVFDRWPGKYRPDDEVRSKAAALSTGMVTTILNTSAFDQIKSRLQPPRKVPSLFR